MPDEPLKSRKPRKKKKRQNPASWRAVISRSFKTGWRLTLPFWPIFVVVGAYGIFTTMMWSSAGVRASQYIDEVIVTCDGVPLEPGSTALSRARVDQVQKIADTVLNRRGLQRDICPNLYHALSASPWVRRVAFVRREGFNHIVADVSLREPVAIISTATSECLVSGDNVRLPWNVLDYRPIGVPRIYIDDSLLPENPGDRIKDAPIVKAVDVIHSVSRLGVRNRPGFAVQAARLTRIGATFSMTIFLDRNDIRVEWGAVREIAEEPSPSEKLERIGQRLTENRARLEYIDAIVVRDRHAPIRLKPLSERVRGSRHTRMR